MIARRIKVNNVLKRIRHRYLPVDCIFNECGICSQGYKDECGGPCPHQITEREHEKNLEEEGRLVAQEEIKAGEKT